MWMEAFSFSNVKGYRHGSSFQGQGGVLTGTVIQRKLPLIRGISWHLVSLFRKFFPLWDGHGPRKCRFLPSREIERSTMGTFSLEPFEHVPSSASFSSRRGEPFKRTLLGLNLASLLEIGYEYSFYTEYYLAENDDGVRDFFRRRFSMDFFVYPIGQPDFDGLVKFRHRNTAAEFPRKVVSPTNDCLR